MPQFAIVARQVPACNSDESLEMSGKSDEKTRDGRRDRKKLMGARADHIASIVFANSMQLRHVLDLTFTLTHV